MVMATAWALVAGGRTICTRSPLGRDADSSGEEASIRCRVEFAASLARRWHQSKSAKRSVSQRQPALVSTKASPGRLIQISVTLGSASKGRSARSVKPREDSSTFKTISVCLEFIHGAEVEVTSHKHLNTVTLVLDNGRCDIERALQHLGHDVNRWRRAVDHRSATARAQARFERNVDDRDQNCCAEAVPEVAIDLPCNACTPELISSRRGQRNDDARRCARFSPQDKYS